jgi:hypothetical protein
VTEAEAASMCCYSLNWLLKIESELIFTIVFLQFKTGVKSCLTSQIKELGAILHFWHQKLNKYEPGLIQINNYDKHLNDVDGDANVLSCRKGLGSVQRRKQKVLTRTRKMRK